MQNTLKQHYTCTKNNKHCLPVPMFFCKFKTLDRCRWMMWADDVSLLAYFIRTISHTQPCKIYVMALFIAALSDHCVQRWCIRLAATCSVYFVDCTCQYCECSMLYNWIMFIIILRHLGKIVFLTYMPESLVKGRGTEFRSGIRCVCVWVYCSGKREWVHRKDGKMMLPVCFVCSHHADMDTHAQTHTNAAYEVWICHGNSPNHYWDIRRHPFCLH